MSPGGGDGADPLRLVSFRDLGATAVVTTRDGGVSSGPYATLNLGLHVGDDPASVITNRRRALEAFGGSLEQAVFADQVHGFEVASITESDAGRGSTDPSDAPRADALVTTSNRIVLAILTADCVPIVCVDPDASVLCVIHAGWRGLAGGVIEAGLLSMAEHGASMTRIAVGIGPAIEGSRYEVGPEVVESLSLRLGTRTKPRWLRTGTANRALVDLVAGCRLVLERHAVASIDAIGHATGERQFFSDRSARPCGRQALLASLGAR